MTGVLVIDDDADIRAAVGAVVQRQPDLQLVGSAASHTEAVALALAAAPEIVLMDVKMSPGGPAATRAILGVVPDARVVAFSAYDDRGAVLEMVDAGAVGYVVKGCTARELIAAIRAAVAGHGALSGGPSATLLQELSDRLGNERRGRAIELQREAMVRRALSGLQVVFQPVIQLTDGMWAGAEALSRFHNLEDSNPASVYEAARSTALGPQLEAAAVRQAFLHLEALPVESFLSVNVSPGALASEVFADLLVQPLDRVVLEITEHAPVTDYQDLQSWLAPWRERGARVAVDDAGAGFASLRHILKLAPDFIKLDSSLTAGLQEGTADYALAAALSTFARETGTQIIAEGIERSDQVEALLAMGVELGQGYHLGRPSRLEDLPAPLRAGRTTHLMQRRYASGPATHAEEAARPRLPSNVADTF